MEFFLFDNDVDLGGGISDDEVCSTEERSDTDAGDDWDPDSFALIGTTLIGVDGNVEEHELEHGTLVVDKSTGGCIYTPGINHPADNAAPTIEELEDLDYQCFVGLETFHYTRFDTGIDLLGGDGMEATSNAQ
ncbi:MAG: hypothetical protein AAEJ53_03385, partial [Myxococcota bacterium]